MKFDYYCNDCEKDVDFDIHVENHADHSIVKKDISRDCTCIRFGEDD